MTDDKTGDRHRERPAVSDRLKEMLIELTITCLLKQPDDVVDYACDYLQQLKDHAVTRTCDMDVRNSSVDVAEEGTSVDANQPQSIGTTSMTTILRAAPRKAVCAEPEKNDDYVPTMVYSKTAEQRIKLRECVRDVVLFRDLTAKQMEEVLDAMFEIRVHPNDVVINEGDVGDYFYVIEDGVYNVYVHDETNQTDAHVHTYKGAGNFGELALLHNVPRAATVKAVTEGCLWAMDRHSFRRIMFEPHDGDEDS